MKIFILKIIKYFVLTFAAYLFLISPANSITEWEKVKERGFITWVTRPSPMTYYSGLDGIIGLEYKILKEFCDSHDLELMVTIASSTNELFNKFENGKIDIAGANLTLTAERTEKYSFSFPYDHTQVVMVSSSSQPKLIIERGLNKYEGVIISGSSYCLLYTSPSPRD